MSFDSLVQFRFEQIRKKRVYFCFVFLRRGDPPSRPSNPRVCFYYIFVCVFCCFLSFGVFVNDFGVSLVYFFVCVCFGVENNNLKTHKTNVLNSRWGPPPPPPPDPPFVIFVSHTISLFQKT